MPSLASPSPLVISPFKEYVTAPPVTRRFDLVRQVTVDGDGTPVAFTAGAVTMTDSKDHLPPVSGERESCVTSLW
jgi:hypothetical protein